MLLDEFGRQARPPIFDPILLRVAGLSREIQREMERSNRFYNDFAFRLYGPDGEVVMTSSTKVSTGKIRVPLSING